MPGRKGWQNHKKLLSAEKECLKSVWQSFLLFTSHNQPPHIFLSFLWSRWDLSLNFESTLRVTHFPLHIFYVHSLVQFSSVTQSCLTLCDPMDWARQASLSITSSQSLFKLMSIESVMPSNHLIICQPLLLPSIFPSIRVFSNGSGLRIIRWLKYWRFSISPSNEYSGLISSRVDWFDFLAVLRDSEESSPTPQFKSINSLALSFLYSSTLASIPDYWKSHSFD